MSQASAACLAAGLIVTGSLVAAADAPAPIELQERNFRAEIDGKPVGLYTIRNAAGMVVRLTNYGARIEQILVPDRNGRLGDVAQGYESIEQVRGGQTSMGAFIGRYAGRIAQGRFTLDGTSYQLAINAPPNSLHGGAKGSRFQVFEARQLSDSSVEMTHVFADGEENYPGTLPLRVVYTVTEANELRIDYSAVAVDKATVVNFTGHAFLNLSGDLGRPVLDHRLTIPASRVLEINEAAVPTGRIREVAGTPLDFRTATAVGTRIDQDDPQLKIAGGYDHTYIPDGTGLRLHARVEEPTSGRVLEVLSDEPGLQFYSGNFLEGKAPRDVGKGGTTYVFRSAFCLEPQHYPDSPNHPDFPSTVLRPGQWYSGQIVYRFSVQK